jgi:hypothetical protein
VVERQDRLLPSWPAPRPCSSLGTPCDHRLCLCLCFCLCPQGYLLATYHKAYWIGYYGYDGPQQFAPMDPGLPQLSAPGSYKHWGEAVQPGQAKGVREPDNASGDESCAVANFTEAFGKPARWGWADTQCSNTFVFLCRMQSEPRNLREAVRTSATCTLPSLLHPLLSALLPNCSPVTATPDNPAGLGFQPSYTSRATGAVYLLNTQPLGLPAAQQACQDKGAQLAAYTSLAQQAEVRAAEPGWLRTPPAPLPRAGALTRMRGPSPAEPCLSRFRWRMR